MMEVKYKGAVATATALFFCLVSFNFFEHLVPEFRIRFGIFKKLWSRAISALNQTQNSLQTINSSLLCTLTRAP